MVFNDIGQKADTVCLFLAVKKYIPIFIRCDRPLCIPSALILSDSGGGKIKDRFKAAVVPDKQLQLFFTEIEQLTDGKGIVRTEGTIPHFL